MTALDPTWLLVGVAAGGVVGTLLFYILAIMGVI